MEPESLIKRLIASLKCSSCGQGYEGENIDILDHNADLWFLRIFCSTCRTQYLVAAVVNEGEAPEVITELTEAELDKFRNAGSLTTDEILDMHNFLKGFDGNFSQLFGQKLV